MVVGQEKTDMEEEEEEEEEEVIRTSRWDGCDSFRWVRSALIINININHYTIFVDGAGRGSWVRSAGRLSGWRSSCSGYGPRA